MWIHRISSIWCLDPRNPRRGCCSLSNAALLNALAQGFIDNKYDLKWLMRTIVNSQAYQLSSRYTGTYNANGNSLFARKMVRRLWGEEIHDAIIQATNAIPTYKWERSTGLRVWRCNYRNRWARRTATTVP
ncbi:MAG TPA: DUF1553 domain-containing protein [Bryobacteraceae bacterium]